MMGKESERLSIRYTFSSSAIFDVEDLNSSFAKGKLKVMYLGSNQNKTHFTQENVERALPTLYNVPIVCNYSVSDNMIGGHDMGVARDENGNVKIVNMTDPCGVVPESAQFSIATETDDDGNEHDYLIADGVILWKRQDVYSHIVNDLDGKVDHSMEVDIFSKQKMDDGYTDITDFQFTALCLLERDAPCFEGSNLTLYSVAGNTEAFRAKFEAMLNELNEILPVSSSNEDDINNFSMEGGDNKLDEKKALVEKYNLTVESLDFSIEDMTLEDLEAKLKAYSEGAEPEGTEPAGEPEVVATPEPDVNPEPSDPQPEDEPAPAAEYSLGSQFSEELRRAVYSLETIEYGWGPEARYMFVDHDAEKSEVYVYDLAENWLLYGFKYSMNGDAVSIDTASKARMKYTISAFEDGSASQLGNMSEVFSNIDKKVKEDAEAIAKFSALEAEVEELRKFKAEIEYSKTAEEKKEMLAKFSALNGNEMFEALVKDAEKYTVEELEDKCYSILGRVTSAKFSVQPEAKVPTIKIDRPEDNKKSAEPYGGIFERFNIK